jgi:hypothetical protein
MGATSVITRRRKSIACDNGATPVLPVVATIYAFPLNGLPGNIEERVVVVKILCSRGFQGEVCLYVCAWSVPWQCRPESVKAGGKLINVLEPLSARLIEVRDGRRRHRISIELGSTWIEPVAIVPRQDGDI